jgi:large subunit ribosomal protein L28
MAKCSICDKGMHFGRSITHTRSQVSSRFKRVWRPNVKSVRIKVPGGTKKIYICTQCLRSGKVERA